MALEGEATYVILFDSQLEGYSNRIGRYFTGKSLSREDSVGLIMESRPEYVGIWLGLSKAGLVGALLNTNLRQDVLIHSIKAANCKAVIFGSNFKDGKLVILGKKFFLPFISEISIFLSLVPIYIYIFFLFE